jgi:arsenate reductase
MKPSVLFVCVHNAGRSQMAAAYLTALAVVEAMQEEGIDISAQAPKVLTDEAVLASDVVITMGCGDACKFYPGKRYEDWVLDDPAGKDVQDVRPVRDEIRRRIVELIGEIAPEKR